jgi:hypothetical protein
MRPRFAAWVVNGERRYTNLDQVRGFEKRGGQALKASVLDAKTLA